MSPAARKALIAAAGAFLALCLCGVFVAGALFAGWIPRWSAFRASEPEATSRPRAAAATRAPRSTPTQDLRDRPTPDLSALSPEVLASMDKIQGQMVLLRGLNAEREVYKDLLTPDELRTRVLEDFLDDYSEEESRDDVRVLSLLGLLEKDYDLRDLYLDLYTEQVAGFYDDEEQAMYVVLDSAFGGPERLTYAHEYVHALQDQTYDFEEGVGYSEEVCEIESDRCIGIQSLIEGDATLAEEQWLRTYATREDIEQIIEFVDSYESPVYDSAPAYLQDSFLFPYDEGLEFVRALFREGGWAAVDAAYTELPASSEQVLHPERYPEDRPVPIALPDELLPALGRGWTELERKTLGELYTRYILEEELALEAASEAAEGWGGDEYAAFYNERQDQGALVLVTVWDTIRDTQDFALAFRDYGDARFGNRTSTSQMNYTWEGRDEYVLFERISDQTLWILAPDEATAQALRSAIRFPLPKP